MIEWIAAIPPAWWVAIGGFISAVGLKLIEKWLNTSTARRDDRKDHRDEVASLQDRVDKVEAEADLWRAKYHECQVEITRLKRALILAGIDVP